MKFVRALTLLVALTIVATACGIDQNEIAGDIEAPSDDTATPSLDTGTLPFDAVLVELFGTADTDAYLMAVESETAELVVACMEDAGFEFQIDAVSDNTAAPDPRTVSDAETRGFGIINDFRSSLSDFDPTVVQFNADQLNQRYLRTLSDAEVTKFSIALNGVDADPGQRQADPGCNGTVSEQTFADWQRFSTSLPNYLALTEERDSHPDWLATRGLWSDCMIERGFDYAEPEMIRADVITRMRETVNESYPGGQVPLIEVEDEFTLDPDVELLLDELFEFEQAAAVANVECTLPLADQFDEVERQVQQAFVDRNRAAIDELLEAAQ